MRRLLLCLAMSLSGCTCADNIDKPIDLGFVITTPCSDAARHSPPPPTPDPPMSDLVSLADEYPMGGTPLEIDAWRRRFESWRVAHPVAHLTSAP